MSESNPANATTRALVFALICAVAIRAVPNAYASERQTETEAERTAFSLYRAKIALADACLAANRIKAARRALAETEVSRRSWEYHYLLRRVEGTPLTLTGHRDAVNAVAWSPDGNRLASGSSDCTVKVWDMRSGKLLQTMGGHTKDVLALAWNPDGSQLASASKDETVRIWDSQSGASLLTLREHVDQVTAVAWSPDGKRLATGGQDNSVRIWDGHDGRQLVYHRGHTGQVVTVLWSDDGSRVTSVSSDGVIKVWNSHSCTEPVTIECPAKSIHTLAWHPDKKRAASYGFDGKVSVWNIGGSADAIVLLTQRKNIEALAWSPDGESLAVAGANGVTCMLHYRGYARTQELVGHSDNVNAIAWSPDGCRIATGSNDNTVKVWHGRENAEPLELRDQPSTDDFTGTMENPWRVLGSSIHVLTWNSDGHRLATAGDERAIRVWDARGAAAPVTLRGHRSWVAAIAWNRAGTRFASASRDHTARLWDLRDGAEPITLFGHRDKVRAVAWSSDDSQIATASGDGTIKIWDARTGRETITLRGHRDEITALAWSPDGTSLASGSTDKTVRVWDTSLWVERLTLCAGNKVNLVAWRPVGGQLASASDDETISLWDTRSGEALRLSGAHETVTSLLWNRGGSHFVTVNDKGVVHLWDARIGRPLRLRGAFGANHAVAWSPDGSRLATGGTEDHRIKIWNQNGDEILRIPRHELFLDVLAWSPDGSQLAAASGTFPFGGQMGVDIWDGRDIKQPFGQFDPWAEDAARRQAFTATWHRDDARDASHEKDYFSAVFHGCQLLRDCNWEPEDWSDLASACRSAGSYRRATSAATAALARRPQYAPGYNWRASWHIMQGDLLASVTDYATAVDLLEKPNLGWGGDAERFAARGDLAAEAGHWNDAIRSFQLARFWQKSDPTFQRNLAWAYLASKALDGSRDCWRGMEQELAASDAREPYHAIGESLASALNAQNACLRATGLAVHATLARRRKVSWQNFIARAACLAALAPEDQPRILALAEAAYRADPASDDVAATLAAAQYRAGRFPDVVEWQETESTWQKHFLALAHYQLGQYAEAR